MISEENFITELKAKNIEALEYMINNFTALLSAISRDIICDYGSLEDVEECVSDIFIFVWKNSSKYCKEKASFKTWISVIAKYKSIDFRRRLVKKLNHESISHDINKCCSNDVESEVLIRELNNQLMASINNLKNVDKQIFIKRYFFNETIEDICKSFNLTRQAVDNRLYRTRKKLKKELNEKSKEVII